MSDPVLDWFRNMESSADYLAMDALHSGMAYMIWARNAYVGIWMLAEQGFLISSYKMGATPNLALELHWDNGEPLGTAKPLRLLERCPMKLLECYAKEVTGPEKLALCTWLDALETKYPPYPGAETPAIRRDGAIRWQQKQAEKRRMPPLLRQCPVWQLEADDEMNSR